VDKDNIMNKPIIVERYADNGSFSHYALIQEETGELLWSEAPEEEIQQVKNRYIPFVSESSLEDKLYNKCLEGMPDITKEEFEEALNTWLHKYTKSKQIENFNPHSR
jgi:hypothetical protein